MNVKKCANGHYFDADKYQLCPHCGAAIADELASSPQKPIDRKSKQPFWKKKEENRDVSFRSMPSKTMGKTFSVFDEPTQEPPRGTKVVRESSHPVLGGSKKDQRDNVDKQRTDNGFELATTDVKASKKTEESQIPEIKQYCSSCGKQNSMRAKFCKFCGAKMDGRKESATFELAHSSETNKGELADVHKTDTNSRLAQTVISTDSVFDAPADVKDNDEELVDSQVDTVVDVSDQDSSESVSTLKEAVKNAVTGNDGKTIGFFSMGTTGNSESQAPIAVDPVVGWLVCIKGNHLGESFSIYAGRNAIGRGVSNKIILSKDNKVSREKHAWITYEPKRRQFYVQPGEGSGLAYLNGEMVMESQSIHSYDELEIGDGLYLLITLCGHDFSWEKYIR